MEVLGDTFVDGKIVSLEKTDIKELNKYLEKVRAKKAEKKEDLNNFLGQIYN
jgi:hypothetical protein